MTRVHGLPIRRDRELDAGAVGVRRHGQGPPGAKAKGEVGAEILAGIKARRG